MNDDQSATSATVSQPWKKGSILAAIGGAVVAVVAVGVVNVVRHDGATSTAGGRNDAGVVSADNGSETSDGLGPLGGKGKVSEPGTPCEGAKAVASADEMSTEQTFFLSREGKFDRAWLCGAQPFFMYGNVQVTFQDGIDPAKAEETWRATVEQWGGRVIEIQGRPAYIDDPDPKGPEYAELLLEVDGQLVKLLGNRDADAEQLRQVAESLALPTLSG